MSILGNEDNAGGVYTPQNIERWRHDEEDSSWPRLDMEVAMLKDGGLEGLQELEMA